MYFSGFFHSNGNYKGFGDSKVVPLVDEDKLVALIKATEAYKKDSKFFNEVIGANVVSKMYSLDPKERTFGFPQSVSEIKLTR